MPSDHDLRMRFRAWLVEHALDPEIADAILETMPPFDWSEIARQSEMTEGFGWIRSRFAEVDARFAEVDARFEQVDARLEQVDARFEQVDARLGRVERGLERLTDRVETGEHRLVTQIQSMDDRLTARIDDLGATMQTMSRSILIGSVSLGLSVFMAIATTLIVVLAGSAQA